MWGVDWLVLKLISDSNVLMDCGLPGSFHISGFRRPTACLLKAAVSCLWSCFTLGVKLPRPTPCWTARGQKESKKEAEGQTGREGEIEKGIKAGYIQVSSDRIKDGMPDPFAARPHPRWMHTHNAPLRGWTPVNDILLLLLSLDLDCYTTED